MKRYLPLFVLLAILMTSCSKEAIIHRKEDRLIGAWEFEKVFYKGDHALFRDNITHEYANDIIHFYPDYTATYDDASLRSIFDGEWALIVDEDYYDGDHDLEFFVDAIFYDFINGEDFTMFGSIDRLNRNKMRLEASDYRGTYTFKLRRL